MTPRDFVDNWRAVDQKERSTAQSHFNDLCDLLGEPKPLQDDPKGERYAFEKGADKSQGGKGWADVWRRGAFAWEYKGKHKDLDRALAQVRQYAPALENPPLLVTCDIERIVVTTNWTNTVPTSRTITLDDLLTPEPRDYLKKAFRGDPSLRTGETRAALTQKVAREFAGLARELGDAGHDPLTVAHFVNRMVFCMFAEDANLLADDLFSRMLEEARKKPDDFVGLASELFRAMSKGGRVGYQAVEFFNGGLFEDGTALPLTRAQIDRVRAAATLDWSAIDPSILGTLFERGLDPAKRSQLGAHYTDPENIMRIVEPVVLRPLREEWEAAKARIAGYAAPHRKRQVFDAFLERLRGVTVLDPACGSGNFLYLALRGLKDLEHTVLLQAESLGLERQIPRLGPEVLRGIELNVYAAELARVSIWIGELQWQIEHGYGVERNPILKPLQTIENRDALLERHGLVNLTNGPSPEDVYMTTMAEMGPNDPPTERDVYFAAEWPDAEFIVGNPPFLGGKDIRGVLGGYAPGLWSTYRDHVPGRADLVSYWFYKVGRCLTEGKTRRVGLVCTNKMRKGSSNDVLRRALAPDKVIFEAWSDAPWHDEKGAAVRVSIVCLAKESEVASESRHLDGLPVVSVLPDLTARTNANEVDLDAAKPLLANANLSFKGFELAGHFDPPETTVRAWLEEPNAAGLPNSDVLRPLWNGRDLAQGWVGRWLIDFGTERNEGEAAMYERPFAWLEERVKPVRLKNNRKARADKWWREGEARPGLRNALNGKERFLVTPETARHRWFRWLGAEQAPEHKLVVIATDDDYIQGILSSRTHLLWAVRMGNWLGAGNDSVYSAQKTLLTFPFPFPTPTEDLRAAVADAARSLNALREAWLNPPEWTQEETLVFPATVGGPWHRWIPDADALPTGTIAEARYVRRVAKPAAAKMVASRTLTKLYNDRPAWLRNAHAHLDAAVGSAYRLPAALSDPDLLAELLRLNLAASGN